jgi:hypothetical protein
MPAGTSVLKSLFTMKVVFRINYWTNPGQSLAIVGDAPFGEWNPNQCIQMYWAGNGIWQLDFHFDPMKTKLFQYRYLLVSNDGWVKVEEGPPRLLRIEELKDVKQILNQDVWRVRSNKTE